MRLFMGKRAVSFNALSQLTLIGRSHYCASVDCSNTQNLNLYMHYIVQYLVTAAAAAAAAC